jgi:trehalose 6-phosphate synthase/phosphatase
MPSRPLVVVSNRLPFRVVRHGRGFRYERSPGGLVSALEPVLARRGGVWIGWSGVPREDAARAGLRAPPADGQVRYRAVPLSGHEVTQYYAGFSNRTIWPLFHYFVGRTRIDGALWRVYDRVNERFAEAAAAAGGPDSLIWVHDYQLLRVPYHVRRFAPQARLAFFLHIPFPAAEVFRVLPWSRALLRGMLAADLVGFHVSRYADHFLTCAERLLGCEADRASGRVQFEGREVTVEAHPISIDAAAIERLAKLVPPVPVSKTRELLAVDRLDYTKGIHERLLAIERLLETHPRYRRHVRFTQVLVPSRERVEDYRELKRGIDETVGRINGRFSVGGWSPVRYFVRSLPPEELVVLYRQADVALVTPLRDGMNLVAKEYVAARVDGDGTLVLSEMAGAAEELQEALVVNPYDPDQVAEALHRALSMPEDERRARMSALRDRVLGYDVHLWVERFVSAAETAAARRPVRSPAAALERRLAPWLSQRPSVALFLDYDGTLTPIAERPEDARPSEALRDVLLSAARAPHLDTVIVSGRALAEVRQLVGVEGLTYVGNHGFEVEGPGISFRHPELEVLLPALEEAARDLEALGAHGAVVERKGPTLAYHVRRVPASRREAAMRRAEAVARRRELVAARGLEVVDIRPPLDWHKGRAVLYVLVHRHGAEWPARVRALYLGDDSTDHDAFRSLFGIGRSIQVGSAPLAATQADHSLPDPDSVLQLLRWLVAGGFAGVAR